MLTHRLVILVELLLVLIEEIVITVPLLRIHQLPEGVGLDLVLQSRPWEPLAF